MRFCFGVLLVERLPIRRISSFPFKALAPIDRMFQVNVYGMVSVGIDITGEMDGSEE